MLRDFNTKAGGEAVEYIDRKWIIRLLYKPAKDLKGISTAQIETIFKKYPLAKSVIEMVSEFRSIFKEKDPSLLLSWIDQATALQLPEFDAFINGLNQDFDAVSNAVSTDFSNGLAEGMINKIKVIKRIMYGRCDFDLLRNKCLLLAQV